MQHKKKILIPRLPGLETGRRTLWPHRKKPHRPGWRCGTLCRIGFEDLKRQQLFHDQIFQPSFISFINEISFVEIYRYFTPRTRKGCDVNDFYHLLFMFLISIHAPVKGATASPKTRYTTMCYFNPRTREGCDPAPCCYSALYAFYFNPRTREGCDNSTVKGDSTINGFQSTHP